MIMMMMMMMMIIIIIIIIIIHPDYQVKHCYIHYSFLLLQYFTPAALCMWALNNTIIIVIQVINSATLTFLHSSSRGSRREFSALHARKRT